MPRTARDKTAHKRKHRHARRHLLVAWMKAPLKVGAVVPSSRRLARAMAVQLDVDKPGVVIELGAGTGVVTHALLQAGVPSERLLVLERDHKLVKVLSSQFPELNIVCGDAAHLEQVLIDHGVRRVNAIVSSLPLLSMPKPVREAIEHCMMAVIGEDGMLVQFTYGPRSPIRKDLLRGKKVSGKRVKTVIANVPPAHVWVYSRG